jgi:hypothetical protein
MVFKNLLRSTLTAQITLLVSILLSTPTVSAENSWTEVETKKVDHGWKVYVTNNQGISIPVLEGDLFKTAPGVTEHDSGLVEITINCGSPCNYSYFVDLKTRRISAVFQFALAVEPTRKMVAVAKTKKEQFIIRKIFSPDDIVATVERDFAPTAALPTAIEKIEFRSKDTLKLVYLTGKSYEKTSETVYIDNME